MLYNRFLSHSPWGLRYIGMVTRRQILQAAGGVGLIAAVPDPIARAAAGVPLHRVVFDSQHERSVRFAFEAGRRGIETSDTRGDIVAVYLRDLMTRWREQPVAVAGLTPHFQLFGLRLLAEVPRLRLVFLQDMESCDPAATARLLCDRSSRFATVAHDHPFAHDALVAWLMAPVPA